MERILHSIDINLLNIILSYIDYTVYHKIFSLDKNTKLKWVKNQTKIINHKFHKEYLINNKPHREDGPAIESTIESGTNQWYFCGILHRENGPAVENTNSQYWYFNGKFHRGEDQPAIIRDGGKIREWWFEGKRHRDNDKPAIINYNENVLEWWFQGKRHRDNDNPAIINYDGNVLEWWFQGKRHRDNDKPAIIKYDFLQLKYYYENHVNIFYSENILMYYNYNLNSYFRFPIIEERWIHGKKWEDISEKSNEEEINNNDDSFDEIYWVKKQ
jgi:hypothetical protein